jgi:hypothetical protein
MIFSVPVLVPRVNTRSIHRSWAVPWLTRPAVRVWAVLKILQLRYPNQDCTRELPDMLFVRGCTRGSFRSALWTCAAHVIYQICYPYVSVLTFSLYLSCTYSCSTRSICLSLGCSCDLPDIFLHNRTVPMYYQIYVSTYGLYSGSTQMCFSVPRLFFETTWFLYNRGCTRDVPDIVPNTWTVLLINLFTYIFRTRGCTREISDMLSIIGQVSFL